MTLGPILGNERCSHASLTYFHSAYSGNYAVCRQCGGHLWGTTEEGIDIPPGVKVVDLDDYEDHAGSGDDEDDAPDYPYVTEERLTKWKEAVSGWGA